MPTENFIDLRGRVDAVESPGGFYAGVVTQQDIPDEFLARLRHIEDTRTKHGELSLAASIPVIFVEKWLREGFNIYQESIEAIEAKCRREGLEHFLVK